MRIPTVPAQAAALPETRPARRPAGTAATAPRLPEVVADRLATLMAGDPALAEAVSARLPAARRDSAQDLAGFGPSEPGRYLDLAG